MSNTSNPIIVGLDVGTTKIVAVAGRKNEHGKLEILGYGQSVSAGVKHGIVLNIDDCIRAIKAALGQCRTNYPQLSFKDVYVGIAGHHIRSRQARGELVRTNAEETIQKEDIEKLINLQRVTHVPDGDEIIDIIPQDFIVDTHNTLQPIGMLGVKLQANLHIVTGAKNDIKNMKSCVTKSGLNIVDLVLQPLASAAAVMTPQDLEAGVAIVDIGGGTTDMAVFSDGILQHTAVIPFAGANITEDIRKGLEVLGDQAELLKRKFGSAIPDETDASKFITIPPLRGMEPKHISQKNLAYIINARVVEIFQYVLYELKEARLENKLHGGIILTGGGSQLQHILQLCQFTTGLPTRMGFPNEHLAGEFSEQFSNPMYSTCIGLILRGYSDLESGKFSESDIDTHISEKESAAKNDTAKVKAKPKDRDLFEENFADEVRGPENPEEGISNASGKKRSDYLQTVFRNLKNKFLKIFDDDPDTEELR